ncbi:MAG: hypothetical protein MK212_16315 [Saprospiraceae bacterium]|nr:hypothetical protein [Saprospiraceae bacterium]
MNKRAYYSVIVLLLMTSSLFFMVSCGGKQLPPLEGVWIEVSEVNKIGMHEIMRRNPIVIDFQKGGEGSSTSFASQTGIRVWEEKLSWTQSDKHIVLTYPKTTDSLNILYQTKDSLVVDAPVGGRNIKRTFKKLNSYAKDAKKIDQYLRDEVFVVKVPSWEGKSEVPFETEFIADRYLMPADIRSLDIMRFWSVVAYKEHVFLIMDGLTGGAETWDMVEIREFTDEGIRGLYYYKNKPVELFLERSTQLPDPDKMAEFRKNLEGTWDLTPQDPRKLSNPPKLPAEIDRTEIYEGERLTFYARGGLKSEFYAINQEGHWWLSKTGALIVTELDKDFSYIRLGEATENRMLCVRRNLCSGGAAVKTVFAKQTDS